MLILFLCLMHFQLNMEWHDIIKTYYASFSKPAANITAKIKKALTSISTQLAERTARFAEGKGAANYLKSKNVEGKQYFSKF